MKTLKRPMYNEDQKMAFIQETIVAETTKAAARNVFENIAPYEEKLGCDIANWSVEELTPVLDGICGTRSRGRYSRISIITNYRTWCVEKQIDGAIDERPDMGKLGYDSMKALLVRNPAHLQQCLDLVFDPEDDETQDNIYRCFFWLAYGGMEEGTIHQLKTTDVSLETMEASYGDEVAVLYRQSLKAVRNCVRLTSFLYRNTSYANKQAIRRDRVPGDMLMRGIRGTPSVANFRAQLSRVLKKSKADTDAAKTLTYTRVWLSGVFYRIYEGEQAGIAPDFIKIAMASPAGKKVLAGESKAPKEMALRAIAKDFRTDYNRWKLIIKSI